MPEENRAGQADQEWAQQDIEVSLRELSFSLAECRDSGLIGDFLKSILTPREVEEVATRWALVKLLTRGMTQRAISRRLGLSLCKITRGSKELQKANSPFGRMLQIAESLHSGDKASR